jgi:outer membrane protein, heavy metal efflux system
MFFSVRDTRAALVTATVAVLAPSVSAQAQTAPVLTLDDALRRSLAVAPVLAQARAGIDAERGRLAQARAFPNPEAAIEAENFAGSRELSGFDGAEVTVSIEQPIELGGKRAARVAVGRAALEAAEVRARLARLDLEGAVRRTYAQAAAAQERVSIAEAEAKTADEIYDAVSKLVAAGREPPLREARARVEQATAKAAALTAAREHEAARRQLAALIGGDGNFTVDANALNRPVTAQAGDPADPVDVALALLEAERARAQVRVERAGRLPDPRLTGGVRRLEAEDSTALVAGVALPLPLFNRNGGNIAAAAAEARRAEAALAQAELEARVRSANARGALETAQAQAQTFASAVIPAAEEALRVARLGYAAGKFPYIELLEAQRALGQARRQRVDAALEVARASTDLDRALGRSLLPE